jgi:HSP20 family protein
MGDLDWRVVRELMAVGERLREVVERALLPPSPVGLTRPVTFEPLVDVWENDTEVIVEAELPGSRGGDIDLRLEGGSLVLSGELPESAQPRGSYLRIERPRGRFHRAVSLPVDVAGEPHATLRGGVLQVRMPKAPAASRRRVSIVREGA